MNVSRVKTHIQDILKESDKPIAASDILELLNKSGSNINKTTVYRSLEVMRKIGEINECDFGEGKKRYEVNNTHHHHLVCKSCQSIEHIDLNDLEKDLTKVTKKASKDKNFKITDHALEFFGVCHNCQVC